MKFLSNLQPGWQQFQSRWLLTLNVIFLMGCQTAGSAAVPARIGADRMTDACRVQMQKFITSTQGLGTVLTPAAFAQSDSLSIVQAPLIDKTGQLAQGREVSMPQIYRLTKNTAGCTMTRASDGTSTVLDSCSCVPLR